MTRRGTARRLVAWGVVAIGVGGLCLTGPTAADASGNAHHRAAPTAGMGGMEAQMRAASKKAAASVPKAGTTITIRNFTFQPDKLKVRPGQKVTVVNRDSVIHTVTSTTGKFNTGDIAPGKSVTFVAPTKAGTYPYRCMIHQFMTGTLVVS
jgi:plastocyanin